MYKAIRAYMLKDSDMVMTQKDYLNNANEDDFVEVILVVSADEIDQWHDEINIKSN